MRLALALLLACLPAPLAALSCRMPAPAEVFAAHDAAPERYLLLQGRLAPLGPVPEIKGTMAQERSAPPFAARFTGRQLGAAQPMPPRRITVRRLCAGPWCGDVELGAELIFFARVEGEALVLEAGPCPWSIWQASAKNRAAFLACLGKDACEAPLE